MFKNNLNKLVERMKESNIYLDVITDDESLFFFLAKFLTACAALLECLWPSCIVRAMPVGFALIGQGVFLYPSTAPLC